MTLAVISDMDGVLLDTERIGLQACRKPPAMKAYISMKRSIAA